MGTLFVDSLRKVEGILRLVVNLLSDLFLIKINCVLYENR